MFLDNDVSLLIWIGLISLIATSMNVKKKETVLGQETERYNMFFAIIVFLPIFIFVVFSHLRSDMYQYLTNFYNLNESYSDVIKRFFFIFDKNTNGKGFVLIELLIKQFFGSNEISFRIITTLLQAIPILLIFRKYSENYLLSVFLFIANSFFDGWMMNGIRQFIASCIMLFILPFLVKRKYIPCLLIVLLASTIHQAAIIMFPIVFIVLLRPWDYKAIGLFVAFSVVLSVYISNSGDLMNDEILSNDDGANPLRPIIAAVPIVLAFIKRKEIEAQNNRLINILINIAVINFIINIIAVFTSGVYVGRLPGFTSIYNMILLPYLVTKVYNEKNSKLLTNSMVILYSAYFLIELYIL